MDFRIEALSSKYWSECADICKFSRSMLDYKDVTSPHIFEILTNLGGYVIGAFFGDKLIGYLFVLPPLCKDTKKLKDHYVYVDDMAVLAEYQGTNISSLLFQRALIEVHQRFPLIKIAKWTFDPLRSKLAHIYINKFGVILDNYFINDVYSENSGDNCGVSFDRVNATLFLEEKPSHFKVQKNISLGEIPEVKKEMDFNIPLVKMRALDNIDEIKKTNLTLVREWINKYRDIFPLLYKNGYVVVAFDKSTKNMFYIFKKV